MDDVEDVVPPFTDVVATIECFALAVGRFALSDPISDGLLSFDEDDCVFLEPVVRSSLPSTFKASTPIDGRIGSGVDGDALSPISTGPDGTCCWLLTDDFSMSASRSMIRSPIPTSHSLSSYSKFESLLISLAVGVVDEVDVFGSVDA